ncbi:TM2 domain-containing protein almondex [Drosophila grimshawi]|uniref:GH12700 n=1 Tax=Drosophila grimshawi TaxID=7222 RepID=B4JKN1_DROGR|nr:TM2 domain-containing protein almondex [Drosophila grimshawi]EDW00134.1 GH12700 [Drosophila grimshawi]
MGQQRECIVVNMRSAIVLIIVFVLTGIRNSETASGGNQMDLTDVKSDQRKDNSNAGNNNNNDNEVFVPALANMASKSSSAIDSSNNNNNNNNSNSTTNMLCPQDKETQCERLQFPCIRCTYNFNCLYGRDVNITCEAVSNVQCQGERSFQRQMNCRYCYQTEKWQQNCEQHANCNSAADKYYRTNCTVHQDVLCLGSRSFTRNLRCNWTQGYRWITALLISLTLGGFGADRFYLGHWQEGIGKLFSFGGLGVWTIIDVLLISMHYLGPADGSLYI